MMKSFTKKYYWIRFTRLPLALLGLLVWVSCGTDEPEPPVADFRITWDVLDAKEPLTMLNESVNATSYVWDLGDGTISSEESPQHSYEIAGSYSIRLTARNDNGEESVRESGITIKERKLDEIWFSDSEVELPPSVLFFFGETGNPDNFFLYRLPDQLNTTLLPFGGILAGEGTIKFTDNQWFVQIIENKEPLDQFGPNDLLLAGGIVNLARVKGEGPEGQRSVTINKMINHLGDSTTNYEVFIRYGFIIR